MCSCLNVAQSEINDVLREVGAGRDALAVLQGRLKCGTSCGSCVPELKQMVLAAGRLQAA